MTAKEQNKLAGIFLLVHAGLQTFVMVILGLLYGGIGAALFLGAQREEDRFVGLAFIGIILFIVVMFTIFIVPQAIGGWKMLKEKPNARTWGIIGSIISCLSFPLGTAAGVFGLVFLFGDAGKQFYFGGPAGGSYTPPPPPQPNSWQ